MASLAPTERASLKVFGIPELTHLICTAIQKRDNVNLMRVCRQLFYYILPFVWEEVDEANSLVSLIPGGGIITYDSEVSPHVVMRLPESLELSRFNIYAPHVKRLTPSALCIDEYDNWEGFLSCTRSVDLLPNLEALHLATLDNTRHTTTVTDWKIEAESVNWIIAFLSTSLRTLALVPSEALGFGHRIRWLDFGLTNSLLTSVAQKCPRLCSFNILPGEVESRAPVSRWRFGSVPQVSFSCDSPEIHSNLLRLSNLSFLLISPVVLSPKALNALSGLPKLETLCILGLENDLKVYGDDLQVPIEPFPALRNLELSRLTWGTVVNLCNAKFLTTKLHSITISYPHHSEVPDIFEDVSTRSFDIIPSLAANSPSITTLALRYFGDRQVSPGGLKSWGCLPLVNLHLGWTVISYCGFEALYSILSRLLLLEGLELNVDQKPFDLKQLRTIVETLPRLRRIQIPVKWGSIMQLTAADFTPCRTQSNNTLYLKSDFYLPKVQQEGAERLARYLSLLRPASVVVCESFREHFYRRHSDPPYIDEQPKDMINLELSRLRSNMETDTEIGNPKWPRRKGRVS
ncbi:hypothetical protein FRC11_005306 [Ceratobasidium sp. 423]|nr:hypothetical protein FRC11_005306 [Ceratobasidium sp. 423]